MEKNPTVQRLLIIAGILTLTLGAFFAGGIVLSSAHAESQDKPGQPGTPGPANAVKGTVTVKAGIHQRIMALPYGYQSFLGRWLAEKDKGVELSGGEWQKIALARMFMRKAEVLILDEPTAALDAQAEYELYTHFRDLMHGCTSLLITHRFSTVRMADLIAVIEHGQIIEQGTHDDLTSCGGTYASLYAMQANQYK